MNATLSHLVCCFPIQVAFFSYLSKCLFNNRLDSYFSYGTWTDLMSREPALGAGLRYPRNRPEKRRRGLFRALG
jgi:hypothetical protein